MCPRDPTVCGCIGHRIPGVRHVVPCCDRPHVDDSWVPVHRLTPVRPKNPYDRRQFTGQVVTC